MIREIINQFTSKNIKRSLKNFLISRSYINSQLGQDFWVYGEVFNQKKGGYFIDIGAFDGITIDNTLILETQYKWTGICIEANPEVFQRLRKNRRVPCINACLDNSPSEVEFVLAGRAGGILGPGLDIDPSKIREMKTVKLKTRRLVDVLEEQGAPSVIDYLSIDVEGAEEKVLGSFDFDKYIFRCITIERPSKILMEKLVEHGYILIKAIPKLDNFYIHNSFIGEYTSNMFSFYEKKHFGVRWK